jgi:subtilase family serine protease
MLASIVSVGPVDAQGQGADIFLTSADITFSNDNPSTGSKVTITVKVHNDGPSAASNVVVEFMASNIPLPPSKTITAIPAFQSQDTTHTWYATVPGTYTIKVTATADQSDPNQANNQAERSITVGTIVPTINVTASLSPDEIQSKHTFLVNGSAEMGGAPLTGGAVKVEILQNGYANETTTGNDGTFSAIMTGPTGQGTYDVKVSVTQGTVTGTTQLNLTVLQPDVTITTFKISPKDPTEGDTVTVTVGIQNIGNGTAEKVLFQLKVDDVLSCEKSLGDLSNGQTTSPICKWKAKKGSHSFSASVDPNNTIEEITESNNAYATQTISVKAKETKPGPSFEAGVFILAVLVIFLVMRNNNGRNRKPRT